MSDTVILAAIAVISPLIVSAVAFFAARSNKREDWRRQDQVAAAVAKVAKTAAETSKTLTSIAETGESTHRIVNNQRTVMLRAIAVLSRAASDDHPDDPVRRKAADDAEHDLAENVRENKVSTGPIEVIVTNEPHQPVPTETIRPTKP